MEDGVILQGACSSVSSTPFDRDVAVSGLLSRAFFEIARSCWGHKRVDFANSRRRVVENFVRGGRECFCPERMTVE